MTLLNVVRPLGRPVSGHPEDQFSGSWPSMTLLEYDWGNMTSVQGLELIGGDIGVLLLQEPTASADLTITWAHSLHEAGMSVSVPMLEKNPVKWQDINSDNLQQWLTISERSLALLKNRCSVVFLVGISMACTIVLRLAELLGEEVHGVILLEPSLPKNRFALRKMWRTIDEGLYLVEQPLIMLYSSQSESEYSENAIFISKSVTSPFVREIVLENSYSDIPIILNESAAFINEVANGLWRSSFPLNERDLIDAEFESIVAGLSLDESAPTTFLDDLDRPDPEEHFQQPNPALEPIRERPQRNALLAMLLGPIYAIVAAIVGFNPFGIEPWPGVLVFIGGLASFFYHLRETNNEDDDGAIL
jgi:predicted alpha/beta hydrolase family esterase